MVIDTAKIAHTLFEPFDLGLACQLQQKANTPRFQATRIWFILKLDT